MQELLFRFLSVVPPDAAFDEFPTVHSMNQLINPVNQPTKKAEIPF